jgi:hypothetical protein
MDLRLKQYTEEQIRKAVDDYQVISITFHDEWCGVERVSVEKVTAKCVWLGSTTRSRVSFEEFGQVHWRSVLCLLEDKDIVVDTFYQRKIEEHQEEIAKLQKEIKQAQEILKDRLVHDFDPYIKKYVRN